MLPATTTTRELVQQWEIISTNWNWTARTCSVKNNPVTKQGTGIIKLYNRRHLADRKLQNNKPKSNWKRPQDAVYQGQRASVICVIQATG